MLSDWIFREKIWNEQWTEWGLWVSQSESTGPPWSTGPLIKCGMELTGVLQFPKCHETTLFFQFPRGYLIRLLENRVLQELTCNPYLRTMLVFSIIPNLAPVPLEQALKLLSKRSLAQSPIQILLLLRLSFSASPWKLLKQNLVWDKKV